MTEKNSIVWHELSAHTSYRLSSNRKICCIAWRLVRSAVAKWMSIYTHVSTSALS